MIIKYVKEFKESCREGLVWYEDFKQMIDFESVKKCCWNSIIFYDFFI